jgi:hypothetical protein
MPIAKHINGGAVSFVLNGQRVTAGKGYVGEVPQRILDKYKRQNRFALVDLPFARVTADVKREEALTREPAKQPSSKPPLGRYIARHRGAGRWMVTETESGNVVSEAMARAEAEAKAAEMNGE